MLRIDAAVLLLCTKFSHWVQRWTGLTNFFLAKGGFVLATIYMFICVANYFRQILKYPESGAVVVIMPILTIAWFVDLWEIDRLEGSWLNGTPAINRFEHPSSRLMMLIFGVLDITSWPLLLDRQYPILEILRFDYGVALAIFAYFSSVHPLPPGRSRVREWLDGFSAVAKPAEVRS